MDRDGRARPVSFAVVAAATLTTLALGYLQKVPCLREEGDDGRDFRLMCFTDVEARYEFPGVAAQELPYIETRIEYPVLTGFTVYLASLPSRSGVSFFNWTAAFLAGCGLIVAWALHRMVGGRALMFAVAPSLLVYAYFNWDLLTVSLATLATLAFLRRRDALSGTLLGLGASAKLYPALLVVPFVAARLRDGHRQDAAGLAGTAVAAWLLVNLPIALLAPRGWGEFFEVSSARGTDLYSLWAFPERHLGFVWPTTLLNMLVVASFVGVVAVAWRAAYLRTPSFSRWKLAFPLLVAFLLTGKAYSPAYSLWLVPWFALTLPGWRLFAAFEFADLAVFVAVFQWSSGAFGWGLPFWTVEGAVLLRAMVLIACLTAWVRTVRPDPCLSSLAHGGSR